MFWSKLISITLFVQKMIRDGRFRFYKNKLTQMCSSLSPLQWKHIVHKLKCSIFRSCFMRQKSSSDMSLNQNLPLKYGAAGKPCHRSLGILTNHDGW